MHLISKSRKVVFVKRLRTKIEEVGGQFVSTHLLFIALTVRSVVVDTDVELR